MKLHRQFDLDLKELKVGNFDEVQKSLNEIQILVEKLIIDLIEKGYTVLQSFYERIC